MTGKYIARRYKQPRQKLTLQGSCFSLRPAIAPIIPDLKSSIPGIKNPVFLYAAPEVALGFDTRVSRLGGFGKDLDDQVRRAVNMLFNDADPVQSYNRQTRAENIASVRHRSIRSIAEEGKRKKPECTLSSANRRRLLAPTHTRGDSVL